MAIVIADRVKETTTTTGTGTITLGGATTGFQSFAVVGNANTTYYTIAAQIGNEWEVGIGTYTASGTTLARTTVLSNSSGTQPSALSFSAGTKDVFVTYPAGRAIYGNTTGTISPTDNAIIRFDTTAGNIVQTSLVTIADDGAITAPQVGSVIPFYYANQAAFPSAASYHGALAHSHADGAMFFAHGSVWNRLLDDVTDVTVAQGGTGLSTLTANNVILGNGTSTPLFVAPSSSGNVLTSNGTTWASTAPAAGGISFTSVKTANYTAANNDGVLTNTTGGGFTVTLPTSPSVGNQIIVADAFSQWGTNNLIIDPTALIKIAGNTAGDTLTGDITGVALTLVYTGASFGWDVFAQVGGNGGTAVTLNGVQTLTNKTIAYGSNTLTDVVGVTATQTLTNKTLTSPVLTTPDLGTPSAVVLTSATGLPLSTGVTGTLPIANGGTGQTTLAAANIAVVNVANTFTGTQTFAGTSSALAEILSNAAEVATVEATAATGTINYDVTTQSVRYFTSNASANWTVNFRASSGTSLNTAMTTGQSVTVAFLVTQGSTAYYNSVVQVDGSTVTPKYQGGTAYAAGNASAVDVYMYTIIKTGNAAFTVFTSQTKFA